jgi:hypothetical protein
MVPDVFTLNMYIFFYPRSNKVIRVMQQISTLFLIILITLSMGDVFHHHDENIHLQNNTGTLYIDGHNCNDHKNHPDLSHNHYCTHCSRIVTTTLFDDILFEFGGVENIDIFPATDNTSFTNLDYLKISEPRSPPQSV